MATNAGLFPHRPPVDDPDRERRVVTLGTEEATALCQSLSSETATSILDELAAEPMVASDVADRVGTSLQNAHYHLERLEEADLITVVDTWYSSRGSEMNVYASVVDEFVIRPGSTDAPATSTPEGDDASDGSTPPGERVHVAADSLSGRSP